MHNEIFNAPVIAVFIARVFLGLLFFFQGWDAVFGVGIKQVIQTVESPLSGKGIPRFFIVAGSWFTSYAALLGGLLLITGLFKYAALYVLGIDLMLAAAVFGIVKPMWDMQFVFPRLVLLLFLLIVPAAWDMLSLDALWSEIQYVPLFTNQ